MEKPHVLVVPLPALGHMNPLMELANRLAIQGLKVTFVNTEFNHKRLMNARSEKDGLVHMVSISDGLEPSDDRTDVGRHIEAVFRVGPDKLEEVIKNINDKEGEKITYIIADCHMGWVVGVAEKIGIRRSSISPASTSLLALTLNVEKLIKDGVIDENGDQI